MTVVSEKREYDRFGADAPIMYAQPTENQYCFYGAKMYNYSRGGLYFETSYPVSRGMIVSIRRAEYSADCGVASTYTEHRGEVKWYREIRQADMPSFGAGVKYFRPVATPPFCQNGR